MRRISQAVILAAGRGQRMMPLTDVLPKPMVPVQGTTLIAQSIRKLTALVPKIHVTVGYKGAMLAQHVIENGVSSVHNTEGKSNAWWIHHTLLSRVDEPVYVLTCDNIIELDFPLLEESYYALGEPACMLVPVRPVSGLEGDYIFSEGPVVTAIDRHRPSEIYCSGVQVLNPAMVARLTSEGGDFYSIWQQLMAKEKLLVSSVYPKRWCSIDTLEQLAEFNRQPLAPAETHGATVR